MIKLALILLVAVLALLAFVWSLAKLIYAIDEAYDAKMAAMRKFYKAAGDANTAARKAGKSTTTFFKEH